MAQNIIEALREEVIKDVFNTASFNNCWPFWKPAILASSNNCTTSSDIIDLGDKLKSIVLTTRPNSGTRGQSAVSKVGTLWECLLTWYLNLCFIGSRAVVIKNKRLLPSPILDALTVMYDNHKCSSEPDLTVIVFPKKQPFLSDPVPFLTPRSHVVDINKLSQYVGRYFELFQVGVIQCKSNWNENSQIPMLWDIVYNSGGIPSQKITVGSQNYNLKDLKRFTYSFVTMPSNDPSIYKPTSVEVSRVRNLSGKNYWGLPTQSGIALSVKEIFIYFPDAFSGSIRVHLQNEIQYLSTLYSYFNI